MPVCQGCGSSFEDSFQFCPHCGRSKPEPQKISIEVDIARKTADDDCPLCGDGAHVQKVSAIVASGTSETNETTDIRGSGKVISGATGRTITESETTGTAHTNSVRQNELARFLSRPHQPQKPSSVAWFPGWKTIAVLAVAVYIFMRYIVEEFPSRFWSIDFVPIIVGILLIALLWWGLWASVNALNQSKSKDLNAKQEYQARLSEYQAGSPVWEKLYYCHKHDVVFVPGKKEHESKEQAWQACVRWGKL